MFKDIQKAIEIANSVGYMIELTVFHDRSYTINVIGHPEKHRFHSVTENDYMEKPIAESIMQILSSWVVL